MPINKLLLLIKKGTDCYEMVQNKKKEITAILKKNDFKIPEIRYVARHKLPAKITKLWKNSHLT